MGQRHGAVENLVSPSRAFWNGRRVFLTGHTGFKGAWLSLWLRQLGADVRGYSLPPDTDPSLFTLLSLAGSITSTHGDVRDAASVRAAMAAAQPEVVFHLAAQALVRRAYAEPVDTYATNVMGTVSVLDAVRDTPSVKAVVVVTTDKCYENREWAWPYRENDRLGGRDPYSSSKACAEIITAAYRDSFLAERNVAVATARAGNVIGGGDWAADRLIPDCVRAFRQGAKVIIRNPAAVRPWQHVLEPLAGYLLLAEGLHGTQEHFASAFNFGPAADDVRPVSWLVAESVRLWGPGAAWEIDGTGQPHEAQLLALEAVKAKRILGWRPRLTLPQALAWTIDWYRKREEGNAVLPMTLGQIETYMALREAEQQ